MITPSKSGRAKVEYAESDQITHSQFHTQQTEIWNHHHVVKDQRKKREWELTKQSVESHNMLQ